MIPGLSRLQQSRFFDFSTSSFPLAIAHRGACAYAHENTESAFRKAHQLDADIWEVDVWMTSDHVCVVSHDNLVKPVNGLAVKITESTWSTISALDLGYGNKIPTLEQTIDLARELGSGLYIEIKQPCIELQVWRLLSKHDQTNILIGSFLPEAIQSLRSAACDIPLSIMIPQHADPIGMAEQTGADIIHLCWREASDQPHLLVSNDLIENARRKNLAIIIWHEDRRSVLDGLEHFPILAICSDRPETLKPYPVEHQQSTKMVCHRGANYAAPENTLVAAQLCFGQGFNYVEVDVRTTKDGHLVVIHDASVDRTTNGVGRVDKLDLSELRRLDAGSWYGSFYTDQKVPLLSEMLNLASKYNYGLYIDVKEANIDHILAELHGFDMLDQCFIGSEEKTILRHFRARSAECRLLSRRRDYDSLQQAYSDFDAQIVEYDETVDELPEIDECKRLGRQAMIFSCTQKLEELTALAAFEPDLINIDRPDLYKQVMKARTDGGGSSIR